MGISLWENFMKFLRGSLALFCFLAFISPVRAAEKNSDDQNSFKRKYAQSLLELKVKDAELKKSQERVSLLEKELNDLKDEMNKIKSAQDTLTVQMPSPLIKNPSVSESPAKKIVGREIPWELKHARQKIQLLDDSPGSMSLTSDSALRARYYLKMAEESFSQGNDADAVYYAKKSTDMADIILNQLDVLNYTESPVTTKPAVPAPGSVIPWKKESLKKNLEDIFTPEKVNINTASQDALVEFLQLTNQEAKNIIWYRDTVGKITYPEELGIVPGLTADVVERISERISFE